MDNRIWIVTRNYSKTRIFKSENEMFKNIKINDNKTIINEYELKSSQNASDYTKARERDTQLRTVLGELSDHEANGFRLVELYESLAKEDAVKKMRKIEALRKLASDKKSLTSYLIREKKYFFTILDDVEWLLAILKCHNFRDHKYDRDRWDVNTRMYVKVDNSTQKLKDNFMQAKKELKNKKA